MSIPSEYPWSTGTTARTVMRTVTRGHKLRWFAICGNRRGPNRKSERSALADLRRMEALL